jgi:predicted O-methyltransferase YrrM
VAGGADATESRVARLRRRGYHFLRHPWLWTRFVFEHELRKREVVFGAHPRFRDYEPMYRAARPALQRLTGAPFDTLDGYFAELEPVRRELVRDVAREPMAGALAQAPLLYVVARALGPARLVETGVASGYSARFLLEALHRNGAGHLHSVGIARFPISGPGSDLGARLRDRPVGWLVPPVLRDRWTVHLGTSDEVLPGLLREGLGRIELFLHDSLHSAEVMRREFELALDHLEPGGTLLSHDVHNNAAWAETVRARGLRPAVELDRDLGAARVP